MKGAFSCWDDRIAPVFDTARQIAVIEVDAGRILGQFRETLPKDQMVQKVLRLVELGANALVCGAVSKPVENLVSAYGIRIIPFVAGDLNEVVQAWIRGDRLQEAFAMPGCRQRRSWE